MKISYLFEKAGLPYPSDLGDRDIQSIVTDSREALANSLFLCMRGTRRDGHRYVSEAIKNGATVIVAERVCDVCVGGAAAYIMLENTRNAAALLYNAWYGDPVSRLKFIGVTGTNGKTSVSCLLYEMFTEWGIKCGLVGTVGCLSAGGRKLSYRGRDPLANMTTPDPEELYAMLAEMVRDGVETVMMEVSSHGLALSRVDAIRFEWGIFTNLTQDHLNFHGSMEEYYLAKRKLFSFCERAVIHTDGAYGARLATEVTCPYLSCSLREGDFCAFSAESLGLHGSRFILQTPEGFYPIYLKIPGSFSVENALSACAVAVSEGIPIPLIQRVLATTEGAKGRMEVVAESERGLSAVIDYAHTPDALEKLLKTLLPLREEGGRILLLFGCGGDRDRGKRAQMGRIGSAYADELILTSDNSRGEEPEIILGEILRGVDKEKPCHVIADRRQAIEYAVGLARKGDILVLAGKGHETYEIRKNERLPFDERAILTEAIEKKRRRRSEQ